MKLRYMIALFLILLPISGYGEETYKFERSWPLMSQPWYFSQPMSVAVNRDGYVYVADKENYRIRKFTTDGNFVTEWTLPIKAYQPIGISVDSGGIVYVVCEGDDKVRKFTGDGKFVSEWHCKLPEETESFEPSGIAVDNKDIIWLRDFYRRRVYKFSSDGKGLLKWADKGSTGNEQSTLTDSIATDSDGFVYVTDMKNNGVLKYDSNGNFVTGWGSKGSGDGQLLKPYGIVVFGKSVYVGDIDNKEIRVFDPNGAFLGKFGSDEFYTPYGIAADKNGFLYVADMNRRGILKYAPNGVFVSAWQSRGSEIGMFETPRGIAIGKDGFLYVADTNNNRIQKFDPNGSFVSQFGTWGQDKGQLKTPYAIAANADNHLYVADTRNDRIQKFDTQGNFLAIIGGQGTEEGLFEDPEGVAVDEQGFVYVADTKNHRIQKFDSDGHFLKAWGSPESDYFAPSGITVFQNIVYATDKDNDRICEFGTDGKFLKSYGISDSLNTPLGIATDAEGNVYVADSQNNRVRKFDHEGVFVTSFGQFGSAPGQMRKPVGVSVSKAGIVYVSDSENNRIQTFRKSAPGANVSKAIIIAGGGPFPGNKLWDSTRMSANFAYQVLSYQGIGKENIRYLSEDDIDLDNNGKADDIAGIPTSDNIRTAITSWAKDADTLVVYLTDHGSNDEFHLNDSQTLSANDLNTWLNQYQNTSDKQVILVYDACMSGSFVPALSSAKNRIVIASTSADEDAYFVTQGSLSFSNSFWSGIFGGHSVRKAFEYAKQSVAEFQHSVKSSDISDDNVFVGNGVFYEWETPNIENVSCATANNQIACTATVSDKDGIARVWAVIIPPDYDIGVLQKPVLELPSFEFMPNKTDETKYVGTYENFQTPDIRIAIFAKDKNGNTSNPVIRVISNPNHPKDKAIIVAGASDGENIGLATTTNAKQAYDALKFQRYADENIFRMTSPSTEALRLTLEKCASSNTHDVLIYLIGKGDYGSFRINDKENLSAAVLNSWLNDLEKKISGKIILIYDADYSGHFVLQLKPPEGKERILISGTSDSQAAVFLSNGEVSFSYSFWNGIRNGANIRDAFRYAADMIGFLSGSKSSQLDDNGNGIGNETSDGQMASNTIIGLGIRLAGAFPGDLRGTITDASGIPIAGATIRTDANVLGISLSNGKFLMPPHPAGTFGITVEAPGYQTTAAKVTITEWGITIEDMKLNPLPQQTPVIWEPISPIIPVNSLNVGHVENDLKLNIPCALHMGNQYRFALAYSPTPSDPLIWKMEAASFGQIFGSSGTCLSVGNDLALNLIAEYGGITYSFVLSHVANPDDPLMWKMDIGTVMKQ